MGYNGKGNPIINVDVTGEVDNRFQRIENDRVSVLDFGAKSDGTDSTQAIDNAIAKIVELQQSSPSSVYSFAKRYESYLYFPPGHYVYNGTGLQDASNHLAVKIIGAGKMNTRIDLPDDIYFIDVEWLSQAHISGIHFNGGAGVIRSKRTSGATPSGHKVIDDNIFTNYSECAISSNSIDHPYWYIARNNFYGKENTNTIGVALAGGLDSTEITLNQFVRNKYHLKLGRSGLRAHVKTNDFFRVANSPSVTHDLWLIPSDDAVNAGVGFRVDANKFGSENLKDGDTRIIFADEDTETGSDIGTRSHSTAESINWVKGIKMIDNLISLNDAYTDAGTPFIKTYTKNVTDNEIDFLINGSIPNEIINFEYLPTPSDKSLRNYVSVKSVIGSNSLPLRKVANIKGFGQTHDPFGVLPPIERVDYTGDDLGFINLLPNNTQANSNKISVSVASASDPFGGQNGTVITYSGSGSGGLLGYDLDTTGLKAGTPVWIEIPIKKSSTNPINTLEVRIRIPGSDILFSKKVHVTEDWSFIRWFWTPRQTHTSLQLHLVADDYVSGVTDQLHISKPNVYHSINPVNAGNLRTLGSSWDSQHLIMGNYHFWVDSTGALRKKNGIPTSDTDGTIIG